MGRWVMRQWVTWVAMLTHDPSFFSIFGTYVLQYRIVESIMFVMTSGSYQSRPICIEPNDTLLWCREVDYDFLTKLVIFLS